MAKEVKTTIVGGGPIGLYTALIIAKKDGIVSVYEEHDEIGWPEHCPGHISLKGLERLNLSLPNKIFENILRGAEIYSPSNIRLEVDMGKAFTVTINRSAFDRFLAETSQKSGVDINTGNRVESIWFDEKKGVESVYILGKKGKRKKIKTSLIVDAEGFPSFLINQIISKSASNEIYHVNGAHIRVEETVDVDENFVEIYLGKYAPGFYAWIIPLRDGSAKVGLATNGMDPHRLIRTFIKKHPVASKKLKLNRQQKIICHPIPLSGPIKKTSFKGMVVVGDAASQVKPTTGGGLITGLLCAQEAGISVLEATDNGHIDHDILQNYEEKWRTILGADFQAMKFTRRLLDIIPENVLDRIFFALQGIDLTAYLGDAVDLDFQGDMLRKPLKSPIKAIKLAAKAFSNFFT